MWFGVPLFPEAASTLAHRVDLLYLFLLALAGFLSLLIAALVVFCMVRYRRRSPDAIGEIAVQGIRAELLEVGWTIVPLLVTVLIFVWGASVFFAMASPPSNSMTIYVVGKQWMWKFQHPDGQREIDELHVPAGRSVKLIMASEDVIHSFFVPAFRMKADVVPGRYTQLWFQATKSGRFHLFCAEYCGTRHSGMVGEVVVMEPYEYQTWLSGGNVEGSLASKGERLFADLACNTCHRPDSRGRGPVLVGLAGKTVQLHDGTTLVADEAYLRESILMPGVKITAGYQPVMPAFQGLVNEEGLLELIEYIKSLSAQPQVPTARPDTPAPEAGENTPARIGP
jgi:cytochrome c oxidase subunit 2